MKKIEKDKLDVTYGLFKFKIPSKQEQISAMGLSGESTMFKKMISHEFEKFYDNLPSPEFGDWLMTHKEFGQTYSEYVRSGFIPVLPQRNYIYIASLSFKPGETLDQTFVKSLFILCESYFSPMKVRIIDLNIDLNGIEYRSIDENKFQVNANQVLDKLYKELPNDAYCLMVFTDTDLYNDNRVIRARNYIDKPEEVVFSNDFCYGLSSLKNRVGIISFTRYNPLFYASNPKIDEKEKLMKIYFILLKRACKVIVKEITHMFGMKNCTFFMCNMNGFNSMEEFDRRPLELCPVCLRKLYSNILNNSDSLENKRIRTWRAIFERYLKMNDTLKINFFGFFDTEISWYQAKIESLKKEM
jgi:archaemetzincin